MNCYKCIHRRNIAGSAHSSCAHPTAQRNEADPLDLLLSLLGKHAGPAINFDAAVELGIELDAHGVKHGWANWPWNFDPTWVRKCNGYEEKA